MVDRRELAGDLRDCISPGATILWRSTAAGTKLWQFGLFWVVTIMVTLLGLALWLTPFGAFDWPYRYLWLIGVAIAIFACTLVLIFNTGSAIVLTAKEIYIRGNIPGRGIQRYPRSDIAEATVFAGDGTVLLHGANGDQTRVVVGGKARDFVEAMAIPARIWIAHEGPDVGGMVSLALIAAAGGILQSIYGFAYGLVTGEDYSGRLQIILILVAAALVLHVLGHWYKAWRMDTDERRRTACMLLDPRWRGCDPYSSGNIPLWQIPKATLTLWLIKAIYRMPTDCATGHEPEIIDPSSHAAAAE